MRLGPHAALMTAAFVTAALATSALGTSPAAADDVQTERARQHYEAATSYYEEARYEDAAREFKRAYELSNRHHLLQNVSVSLERSGDLSGAIAALEKYLEAEPQAEDRSTIEARLENLRERQAEQAPAEEPAVEEPAAEEPAPKVEAPAPGTAVDSGGDGIDPAALALLIGGGVAAIGAVITGVVAHGNYNDLEDQCSPDGVCPANLESTKDEGEAFALVSTVLTAASIVAVGVGLVLLLTGGDSGEAESVADAGDLRLGSGPGEVGASLSLTF